MVDYSRPRQPGASLARKQPPRILDYQPIPSTFTPSKPEPFRMDLSDVLAADQLQAIAASGRVAFHCIGDSGGVKRPEAQALVALGMERSLKGELVRPSFCYHLGDVVYYTGQVEQYWSQFYEPYEHYPLPIMGVPGNHDGELTNQSSVSLLGFFENFVASASNGFTNESRDSGRPAMHQPWFYWTLTTPFATIVGLYTNVPEHGKISDEQRRWFCQEMQAADRNKALIVALHHPVYSFDQHHSGSPNMAMELQNAINQSRRIPNLIMAGHVHNYQRIELRGSGFVLPFLVIGNSGYWNLHNLSSSPGYADPETGATLVAAIDDRHGFMTIDISAKIINGHFTTTPRPQESWSDPKSYNANFDVFSYSAEPLFLADGAMIDLVPAQGSHISPYTI